MLDPATLLKARCELARLNRELQALHLEEERCKLRRSRLEADKARVGSLVELCELAQRLTGPAVGTRFTIPGGKDGNAVTFHLEDCHGAKLVVADKPAQSSTVAPPTVVPSPTSKPEGTPTIAAMIVAALEDAASRGHYQLRPAGITEYVRRKWWPKVKGPHVSSVVWKMARDGKLQSGGGLYRLNRTNGAAGHGSAAHV